MTASAMNSFSRIVRHYVAPVSTGCAARLQILGPALSAGEIDLLQAQAHTALLENAQLKLNRLLLLELHAAVRAGQVSSTDPADQLQQFVALATSTAFADHLRQRYPALMPRFDAMQQAHATAIVELATHIGEDRAQLEALVGQPAGLLTGLSLGKGDLHGGGRTVAKVSFEGGTVMYKPRSLRIDAVLDHFLGVVFPDQPERVRVPRVVDCGDHGWAGFAMHRFCSDDTQLATYYRGLGHWLAILRLIGGTDIHLENLIACGPTPVIVDAESVFSPPLATTPSGYGNAYDMAVALMHNSVLRTGIVPFRTNGLGMEGVDLSAAGALPGEQPKVKVPIIVEGGEYPARLGMVEADFAVAQNHPCERPDVSRFWDEISEGFMQASSRLRALDHSGSLARMLEPFQGCQVREVQRPTMAYAEIGRMLWHPASLHNEPAAIARAMDLLIRNAAVSPAASAEPDEVLAEINALRVGDIPLFAEALSAERIDRVVDNWRSMRIDLEELTIRSTLVATDLNQHALARAEARDGYTYAARNPRADDLEQRRRGHCRDAVNNLIKLCVHGDDGTITWITPEITQTGWTVQPVQTDAYFGLGGIAFALAAYQREVAAGRALPVDGLDDAVEGAVRIYLSMCARDQPVIGGGLVGAGARIWTLLTLHRLLEHDALLSAARDAGHALAAADFADVPKYELLDGLAGSILPLIQLTEVTGERRWLDVAARAARTLQAAAVVDERGARWPTPQFDEPIGGFAHGAMGIGWVLARLALTEAGSADDRVAWQKLASGAFKFQDALFEPETGRWRDLHLRDGQKIFPTWCHGSVGMGLAAADLYARTGHPDHLRMMRRAVADASGRWGFSHTLCHGDLSIRELLVRAAELDPDGCPYPEDSGAIEVISSIEEHHGLVGGLTRAAFTPGLMIGLAGAVYGLCCMHPDCRLPSPLLLEHMAQPPVVPGHARHLHTDEAIA